jgi:hypothetical protein
MKFRKNAGDVSNTQNKIQLFPILLINFIGTLGFSIVLPFLVFPVKDFGGNAIVFWYIICNISYFSAYWGFNTRKTV